MKRRQKPSITGTVSSAYLRLFNRNRWSYNRLSILLVMGRSRANPLPEANLCRLACTSSFDRRRLEMMRSVDSRSIRIVRVFHGLYTVPTRPLQGPLHHSHRIHCPLGAKQGPSRGQAGAKGWFDARQRRSSAIRKRALLRMVERHPQENVVPTWPGSHLSPSEAHRQAPEGKRRGQA